jgi:endo-1,4-beta-xylanase
MILMKNGIFKRALSTVVAGFLVFSSVPFVAKEMKAEAAKTLTTSPGHTQETDWYNDYHHEIWQADTPNSSTMTLADEGGGFSTKWQCGPNGSRGNFLARRGLFYGRHTGKQWRDYGNFTCQFDCDWSAGTSGNSRICIYGWTEDPLVEFYIIEDWKNWVPRAGGNTEYMGTVNIDGSDYDILKNPMNSYNITNQNGPFTQYISVRKNTRTSGTISIYKHFEAWEKLGMKMGDFYEVAFNVEGWESDGQANVKKNIITYKGDIPDVTTEPATAPDPDSDGNYISEGFESGKGDFKGRGDATVSVDNKNYYDGKASLLVSGRTKNWHGGAIELDSSTFVPGNTYSISAAALQKSGSTKDLKLTLEYTAGDQDWKEVASADAKSGEWTKLENTEFTIPSGASNMTLYIESSDENIDINIDNVQIAKAGKSSSVKTGGGTVDSTSNPNPNPNPNPSEESLKNVFSKYFKFGTAVSENEVKQHGDFIKKHFNSITPENELKPQYILDQSASQQRGNNVNPQVTLPSSARTILDFAVKNNIPVRGHTLIWHSQTPAWLFKENFSDNGATVSKEVMDQRIKNYIKNVFDMLKKEYPTLNLYAYDVANECFSDNYKGFREAGWNQRDGQSPWMLIYNDDSFLVTAFAAAKEYAPKGCKLFYNDYNEYYDKLDPIYNLCSKLYKNGTLDGVGMQSHLGTSQPSVDKYETALKKYASIGCEIHVTELDITKDNGASDSQQATSYKNIVNAIKNCDKVTSLTVWGTNDNMSWRRNQQPLLFNGSYQPKEAYNAIIALVPQSEWGQTSDPQPTSEDPTEEPTEEPTGIQPTKAGDANNDNLVDMSDVVMVMQYALNPAKYGVGKQDGITEIGLANADVDNTEGVTVNDALLIQKFTLHLTDSLSNPHAQKKKTNNVTTSSTTTTATVTTAADANYFKSSFNSDSDGWSGRGDASVAVNKDNYYSGNGSIKVTGRTKNWNGAAIKLDSSYKAGETYSFSAAVLQKAKESDTFNITLQYNDSTGTETYDNIATVKANKNTWTKLENTNYTIPAGATDLIIYIETAESTIDFFVDEAAVSAAGTKSAVTTGSGTVAEEPEVISQVDPSKPMIAISFDDGCSPANNKRIVDALTEQGFHATFFYVSNWSQGAENQAEIKYAYSKGMEIANHTVSHPSLGQKSSSEIRQEADGCHNYLKSVLGVEPSKLLRLPYLDQGGAVKSTLTDYGLVTDAIDTMDYKDQTTKDQIVQTIKQAMANGSGNGAVVLCHETYSKTAAAIEELAPYIKAQGWQIVTISEMFEAKGKSIPYGQIITRV